MVGSPADVGSSPQPVTFSLCDFGQGGAQQDRKDMPLWSLQSSQSSGHNEK